MAQASKAIIPKDAGGPWGMKIGVSLGGPSNWTLRVGAYMTGRAKSSDWSRYSLVVLNWDDNSTVSWNPTPVETTIEFHGRQVCLKCTSRGSRVGKTKSLTYTGHRRDTRSQ